MRLLRRVAPFELRACAELRHKVLKLDPILDAQFRPLLGGVPIKCDRISGPANGDALQNSILAFLRDLRRLDFCGLLQEFGRNRHNSGVTSTPS
jgi:hypothetical protein